jgi:ribosome maturation factor RimP
MTARTPQRQHLIDLLGAVITSQGYDLEDLSVTAAGRRSLIRITVDGDHGIDLDAVADVSRAISEVLDSDGDSFAGPYVLEVSSPGVDRPLTEARHWRRSIGRLVTVQQGAKSLTGRVVAADDTSASLDVGGVTHTFAIADLGTGKIQVEFSRPGQPEPDEARFDDSDEDEEA